MKIYDDITKTVGRTPLVQINTLARDTGCRVLAKLESRNPTSSVKDRIALAMIEDAEAAGALKPKGVIIEPTSGNTGIGLACVAAARGYCLILTMPETMSVERRKILEYFGARVVLTPGEGGMQGAVDKARELVERTPGAFMPSQFTNPSNPGVHRKTTAVEIWEDTGGEVDGVVAGIGTGGTLSGIARELKSRKPTLLAVGVEPESSQVLSGKPPGKHGIQGIGAGFIPKVLDRDLLDRVVAVSDREAIRAARLLASREGIFCGISSGAAFHGALEIAGEAENAGKTLVVILPDSGERYLSTPLFETQ